MNQFKYRNSSTELFRILAMLLVVFVHMNGSFLVRGHGLSEDINGVGYNIFVNKYLTEGSLLHEYIQALCAPCVNCFIIISGYYGIKLKLLSLWRIFLTVISVKVPFAIGMCIFHPDTKGLYDVFNAILGLSGSGYFVQCYVMLIFLSPILNSFIDKYGRKSLKYIVAFVLIEGYICMFRIDEIGFEMGYRIIHFMLIYLVARCLHLYKDELLKVNNFWFLLSYIGGAIVMAILYKSGFVQISSYSNPLTIIMAIGLFVPFAKKSYYNGLINWIAGGTFSVYLINTTMPGSGLYYKLYNYVFDNYSLFQYYFIAIGISLVLFVLSILYDRMLKLITKPINGVVTNFIETNYKSNILD